MDINRRQMLQLTVATISNSLAATSSVLAPLKLPSLPAVSSELASPAAREFMGTFRALAPRLGPAAFRFHGMAINVFNAVNCGKPSNFLGDEDGFPSTLRLSLKGSEDLKTPLKSLHEHPARQEVVQMVEKEVENIVSCSLSTIIDLCIAHRKTILDHEIPERMVKDRDALIENLDKEVQTRFRPATECNSIEYAIRITETLDFLWGRLTQLAFLEKLEKGWELNSRFDILGSELKSERDLIDQRLEAASKSLEERFQVDFSGIHYLGRGHTPTWEWMNLIDGRFNVFEKMPGGEWIEHVFSISESGLTDMSALVLKSAENYIIKYRRWREADQEFSQSQYEDFRAGSPSDTDEESLQLWYGAFADRTYPSF